MKERNEHVHEAAQRFLHPYFEGILFPGSREGFLGTLPRVPGSTYLPGWVFTFSETEFALLGKLTRNPESFKPIPGSNCAYTGTTIFGWV